MMIELLSGVLAHRGYYEKAQGAKTFSDSDTTPSPQLLSTFSLLPSFRRRANAQNPGEMRRANRGDGLQGSPAMLIAGEWIAVFSYNENRQQAAAGEIFVDVYDQRMGYKLMTTALPFAISPNELFKHATWIEGGYILCR